MLAPADWHSSRWRLQANAARREASLLPRQPASRADAISQAFPCRATAAPTPRALRGPIEFTDVTAQAGIHFKHNSGAFGKKYLPETMGSGVCFLDYDNDGWQDILLVNSMDWPGHKVRQILSPRSITTIKDGTFTDVTRQAGLAVEMYGLGCAVGDYDNDGYDDIYITTVGSNHLFHNLGNGKFADVTAKAGVADPGFSASAVWFDYDNDGKLDLFVAHYIDWSIATDQYCSLDNKNKSYCTPQTTKAKARRYSTTRATERLRTSRKRAGLYDPTSKSLGVALLDYDNDGWMDLFVSNDTEPNKLYHNNHNGTFTDVAVAAGVALQRSGHGARGNGHGRGRLRQLRLAEPGDRQFHQRGHGALSQRWLGLVYGRGTDRPASARMSTKSLTFGTFFFDYDLDGLPDILAVNGHVSDDISVVQPNVKYAQPPHLFRNLGKSKFEEVTAKVGAALQRPIVGRGAAYADYRQRRRSGSGDHGQQRSGAAAAQRQRQSERHAARENRGHAIESRRHRRESDGQDQHGSAAVRHGEDGSSYLSQSELPLTFGLGKPEAGKTVSLEIVWPSGGKESIAKVSPNQFITVKEGAGIISARPISFGKSAP